MGRFFPSTEFHIPWQGQEASTFSLSLLLHSQKMRQLFLRAISKKRNSSVLQLEIPLKYLYLGSIPHHAGAYKPTGPGEDFSRDLSTSEQSHQLFLSVIYYLLITKLRLRNAREFFTAAQLVNAGIRKTIPGLSPIRIPVVLPFLPFLFYS